MKSSLYGAGAEYAIHSLLLLSAQSEPTSVRDLANFQQLPERFLAKIFTRLVKAKLVVAAEGISGGFVLARPADNIPVGEILEAVDPKKHLFTCAEIRRNCILYDGNPPAFATSGVCGIHAFMLKAEHELRTFLASKTLADVGAGFTRKAPQAFFKTSDIWFANQKTNRNARSKQS